METILEKYIMYKLLLNFSIVLFADLVLLGLLLIYDLQLQSDKELHQPYYKNELSACERLHL